MTTEVFWFPFIVCMVIFELINMQISIYRDESVSSFLCFKLQIKLQRKYQISSSPETFVVASRI